MTQERIQPEADTGIVAPTGTDAAEDAYDPEDEVATLPEDATADVPDGDLEGDAPEPD